MRKTQSPCSICLLGTADSFEAFDRLDLQVTYLYWIGLKRLLGKAVRITVTLLTASLVIIGPMHLLTHSNTNMYHF